MGHVQVLPCTHFELFMFPFEAHVYTAKLIKSHGLVPGILIRQKQIILCGNLVVCGGQAQKGIAVRCKPSFDVWYKGDRFMVYCARNSPGCISSNSNTEKSCFLTYGVRLRDKHALNVSRQI